MKEPLKHLTKLENSSFREMQFEQKRKENKKCIGGNENV